MTKSYIIAIDGLAASGKTTLTKNLANKLGFEYLLTGNIYRLVAKNIIAHKILLDDEENIIKAVEKMNLYHQNTAGINNDEISKAASIIATLPQLRQVLDQVQRDFAHKNYIGIVVEGRDIGSVIFPNANIKFFITANLAARAKRRYKELLNKGFKVIYENILEDLEKRDERDTKRSISPLMRADDAIEIDTSDISSFELLTVALDIIKEKSAFKLL